MEKIITAKIKLIELLPIDYNLIKIVYDLNVTEKIADEILKSKLEPFAEYLESEISNSGNSELLRLQLAYILKQIKYINGLDNLEDSIEDYIPIDNVSSSKQEKDRFDFLYGYSDQEKNLFKKGIEYIESSSIEAISNEMIDYIWNNSNIRNGKNNRRFYDARDAFWKSKNLVSRNFGWHLPETYELLKNAEEITESEVEKRCNDYIEGQLPFWASDLLIWLAAKGAKKITKQYVKLYIKEHDIVLNDLNVDRLQNLAKEKS